MKMLENRTYDELNVGDSVRVDHLVKERDLILFAEVSGDVNPVHLDEAFAANTPFKGRIAHGMFSGALISATIACELPGPGTIYIGQEMSFLRPVRLDDTISIELEVLEKLPKNRVKIATRVFNQDGKKVVDGVATVMAPTEKTAIPKPALPPISF
ncbi:MULTISPECIES: MaoC/PaaZ C-terminal domain-containing protein [Pseudomonas]|uniref:3-hydroxybutyryl-CoA dehydratase n=1 Tax=Pseudomonas neustonica TaxID=2487346 RepID=A0ABX9XFB2_9PSED|nr:MULTISPECIES: MaoC/PaaZ C-terminal domain-containing protein [Pseudomonas]MBA6419532.1 MaoC family dehydratase N-terminal domain-containing protein [Pseudomonas sp. 5Ae-yellow]ROZ82534.1 3-hydroxybutyryl-CoA dehydratase [Pseudomonas neustonica]ROZ82605.1 3-hydroxybutyryl-CoA dehydratase [Pseudomonas sp. SSM44]|tara:strand:- start:15 stop:482 length:468 start_codon:yes stop_codon:yes gene_type:complete